jgi:Zn-finger nucleic acid-binding protein
MMDRQGIEVDYCPKCRGVWLDRGELEKLIERTAPMNDYATASSQFPPAGRYEHDDRYPRDYRRKRKGFLGDLFDFD